MIQKMEKKFLVSFLLAVSVLVLAATAVSATSPLATITNVQVNGVDVAQNPAIVAGDSAIVRVDFSSLVNTQNVAVKVEIQGNRNNVQVETGVFDVESGFVYSKSLSLNVPLNIKDSLSDFVTLTVKISGDNGFRTDATYTLRVQRPSYNADIMSVSVPQNVNAGQLFPVDFVLKNVGYNDLTDLYVTASIPALGITQTSFVGDLVALECNKDATAVSNFGVNITRKCNENSVETTSGRVFIQLPWDAKTGTYALQLTAKNSDTTSSQTVQVNVQNPLSSGNFIVSGNQMLIVNPTNQVVVYRLVPESTNAVTVSVSDSVVAVPAGSSRTVTVSTSGSTGAQNYFVDVFSADGSLLNRVNFTTTETGNAASPIVVLTIILAIIFIVLLVVLIVLIGKKPEKSEEFGESYY